MALCSSSNSLTVFGITKLSSPMDLKLFQAKCKCITPGLVILILDRPQFSKAKVLRESGRLNENPVFDKSYLIFSLLRLYNLVNSLKSNLDKLYIVSVDKVVGISRMDNGFVKPRCNS